MFIKKTKTTINGKTYFNYLLVESVRTPKGPRHKVICSLGSLKSGSVEEWKKIANRLKAALNGQQSLYKEEDEEISKFLDMIAERERAEGERKTKLEERIEVDPNKIKIRDSKELGPELVGGYMWSKLGLSRILREAGFSDRAIRLTKLMLLNRLIEPKTEYGMLNWIKRTALDEVVGIDVEELGDDSLYRNLDRLISEREEIEKGLVKSEREIFNLSGDVLFYDLTSSYFEGLMLMNPKAKRGYSRDKRGDCKQVVIGVVVGAEGFPVAHEVFDGNKVDATTLESIIEVLNKRSGIEGKTIIMDRGLATEENIRKIKGKGMHYIVASRSKDIDEWMDMIMEEDGWKEIVLSGKVAGKKEVSVKIKGYRRGEEMLVLCLSEGRKEKDRAIRESQEKRMVRDIKRLEESIKKGRIVDEKKIYERIGRIRGRYPRVGRYYEIETEKGNEGLRLRWSRDEEVMKKVERLDGAYLLLTDRTDMSEEEIFKTYKLLIRAESAFEDMKSPLSLRPIYHHLERRTEAHIFLCILAYHLLIGIETYLRRSGDNRSWETIKEILKSHNMATVVIPEVDGREYRVRKMTVPSEEQREIYRAMGMSWVVE